jgi:benzoyl-CoA 2,3-dioxygenase component B
LQALNERLRQDYIEDCARGVLRWNKIIEKAGIAFEIKLPHRGFNRRIGAFAGLRVSPDGKVLSEAEWKANEGKWLPTDEDRAYVTSLMGPAVVQPGKFAHWIAPPARGINGQPADFEYVRFN